MSDDNSAEELSHIVLDGGSHFFRAGFAGDDAPRAVFPPIIAQSKFKRSPTEEKVPPKKIVNGLEMNSNVLSVGDDATTLSVISKSRRPGRKGIFDGLGFDVFEDPMISATSPIDQDGLVTNWDQMEDLWNYTFYNELRVMPAEHGFLLTERCLNQKSQREKQTQIFFETLDVPSYYVSVDVVLSTYSSGRTSALAVDSGFNSTTVAPIYEGYLLPMGVNKCRELGGTTVDLFFAKLMMESGRLSIPGGRSQLNTIVRDMKEKTCMLPSGGASFKQEMDNGQVTQISAKKFEYELPDGSLVNVPKEVSFLTAECLFFPDVLLRNDENSNNNSNNSGGSSAQKLIERLKQEQDSEYGKNRKNAMSFDHNDAIASQRRKHNMQEAILTAIFSSEMDLHRDLFNNIVISGGNTMFEHFGDRLKERLRAELASNSSISYQNNNQPRNFRVVASPERKYSQWIGGSILASLSSFEDMLISKEEYEENGPSIVHKKCY